MASMPLNTKQVQDAKLLSSFHVTGGLALEELHDAGAQELNGGFVPEDFDLMAQFSVDFNGEVPTSARVLNAIVMDWVDAHRADLENLCLHSLKVFMAANHPNVDMSELGDKAEGLLWDDQVDYMAGVDPKSGKLFFDVELVLDFE